MPLSYSFCFTRVQSHRRITELHTGTARSTGCPAGGLLGCIASIASPCRPRFWVWAVWRCIVSKTSCFIRSVHSARSMGALNFFLVVALSGLSGSVALSTINDVILDENGAPLTLMGASWFGFNNNATMVRVLVGLWKTNTNCLVHTANQLPRQIHIVAPQPTQDNVFLSEKQIFNFRLMVYGTPPTRPHTISRAWYTAGSCWASMPSVSLSAWKTSTRSKPL